MTQVIRDFFMQKDTPRLQYDKIIAARRGIIIFRNVTEKNMKDLQFYEKDGELTAALYGELDHCLSADVRVRIDEKVRQLCPRCLVLDLSDITFMDSSGLGLIMGRYTLCGRAGIAFRLRGADERINRMLGLAGLGGVIKIEANGNGGSGR